MCWFQGEKSPTIPELNRECIERWKNLNKDWEVNIISFKNVKFYVPDFFDILGNSPYRVRLSHIRPIKNSKDMGALGLMLAYIQLLA